LISYVIKKFPTNTIAKEGHATINVGKHTFEKNKIELTYQMWSMDKIKPDTDALIKWIKKYKGRYIVSCKLDGISALYSNESGIPKLYTRGNGIIGHGISHLIPYLSLSGISKNVAVRGEIIMPKQHTIA
jgi:NAD-dependent DNA ligase